MKRKIKVLNSINSMAWTYAYQQFIIIAQNKKEATNCIHSMGRVRINGCPVPGYPRYAAAIYGHASHLCCRTCIHVYIYIYRIYVLKIFFLILNIYYSWQLVLVLYGMYISIQFSSVEDLYIYHVMYINLCIP